MMETIILAGGFGTRLRQVVPDWPKPMAPVAGRPFLEILLASLAAKGVRHAVLSLGYMADKVMNHFGPQFHGIALSYVVEEAPLGTGGAIRLAMQQCHDEHLLVLNGDTFVDLELAELAQCRASTGLPLIVGCEVPDASRYGRLEVREGRVCGFLEKGAAVPGIINAGCYVLARTQLDAFPLHQPFSLETGYLASAVTQTAFGLFVTRGKFIDIGVPEDYLRAQTELAGPRMAGPRMAGLAGGAA